jgi:hypothetical protein
MTFGNFRLGSLGKVNVTGEIKIHPGSALSCNALNSKKFIQVIFSREGDDGILTLACSEFGSGNWSMYRLTIPGF